MAVRHAQAGPDGALGSVERGRKVGVRRDPGAREGGQRGSDAEALATALGLGELTEHGDSLAGPGKRASMLSLPGKAQSKFGQRDSVLGTEVYGIASGHPAVAQVDGLLGGSAGLRVAAKPC